MRDELRGFVRVLKVTESAGLEIAAGIAPWLLTSASERLHAILDIDPGGRDGSGDIAFCGRVRGE
jgi:hypothetical protein